jgi:hypothetical protein
MAVKNEDNNQNAMSGAFGEAQASAPQMPGATQQQEQRTISWRGGLGGLGNLVMNRNPASEVLTGLEKVLSEQYSKVPAQAVIRLIPLDLINNPSLGLSALAVCMHMKNNAKLGVAVHTLIIEGSANAFDPYFHKTAGGNSVPVIRVAGDAYDDNMRAAVFGAAQKAFPGSALLDAGPCVVPRDFDQTNQILVYSLAASAAIAVNTTLEMARGGDFKDLCLKDFGVDPSLTARVSFNAQQSVDAVGLPVRGPIVIQFQAGGQAQQGQPIEQARDISEIRGFMDLSYDSAQAPNNIFNPVQAANQNRATYINHFIMTSMYSVDLQTLPAQLLALVTSSVLREQNAYGFAWKPKPATDRLDLQDIGAIGLEVGPRSESGQPMKFDTKSDAFRPEQLGQMLQVFMHPGMMVSMDVAEAGAQTWFNDVFIAAGKGKPAAQKALIDAANYLTSGRFGVHYQAMGGSGNPIMDTGNRIHMGYFTNHEGIKKDIREIDYLAILNLFPNDHEAQIRTWSNSLLAQNIDPQQRLNDRMKMLEPLNPTITGFARRLTIEGKYLEALLKGSVDCGLTMRPVFPHSDTGVSERIGGQFSNGSAILTSGITGMFSNSGFQTGGSNFNTQQGFSRWG